MVVMYDDINLALIPHDAQAVAGYVNGRWPTYQKLVVLFPKALHLSIAVNSSADAECLDVEPGDATPAQALAWAKRQIQRGVKRPVIYCSLSQAQTVVNLMSNAGFKRNDWRLWTAHYTFRQHFCGPQCGFGLKTVADATQWTDKSQGRSLDESICDDKFFATVRPSNTGIKVKAWRERLRHVQALLRQKTLPKGLRYVLQGYARKLRALIRGAK